MSAQFLVNPGLLATENDRMNILVAIDGSAESREAFRFAYRLAKLNKSPSLVSVSLFHCIQKEGFFTGGSENKKEIEAFMMECCQKLQNEKISNRYFLRQDCEDIKTEICIITKSDKADLLVIGHGGKGAIKRAIIGSVSEYCVNHAECPVVVVKCTSICEERERSAEREKLKVGETQSTETVGTGISTQQQQQQQQQKHHHHHPEKFQSSQQQQPEYSQGYKEPSSQYKEVQGVSGYQPTTTTTETKSDVGTSPVFPEEGKLSEGSEFGKTQEFKAPKSTSEVSSEGLKKEKAMPSETSYEEGLKKGQVTPSETSYGEGLKKEQFTPSETSYGEGLKKEQFTPSETSYGEGSKKEQFTPSETSYGEGSKKGQVISSETSQKKTSESPESYGKEYPTGEK